VTLPLPRMPWNIKQVTTDRARAVAGFGFTERQARFLVEVMIHSGVFVPRQYCNFSGIVHGQKTHNFLKKLVERGYAVPIQIGALHRGRLFHVRYKPLYAAIGQTDNRHRKPAQLARFVERLMILDAVLADRTVNWLGTEADKVEYTKRLDWPPAMSEIPQLAFGTDSTRIVRYFPDKLPIGMEGFPIEHVLVYLVTSPNPDDFRLFLGRHSEFLMRLNTWIVRVLVPQPLAHVINRFGHAARDTLATPLTPSAADELRWFFPERQRRQQDSQAGAPKDDARYGAACFTFRAPRYRVLFRLWQQIGELAIWNAQMPHLRDTLELKKARVEFVRLSRQYLHLSRLVGAS
jgi:hypothetical protein